jgi:hypothetical protein
MPVIIGVGWLLTAALTAWVASKHGRSVPLFFALGLFLAPIALPLVILEGPVRRCPFCREGIRFEAEVCRHCGRDLFDEEGEEIIP